MQRPHDALRDLPLNSEDVGERRVERLLPFAGGRSRPADVHELRLDSDLALRTLTPTARPGAVLVPPHFADQQVPDAKLTRNLLRRLARVPVLV